MGGAEGDTHQLRGGIGIDRFRSRFTHPIAFWYMLSIACRALFATISRLILSEIVVNNARPAMKNRAWPPCPYAPPVAPAGGSMGSRPWLWRCALDWRSE